MSNDVGYRGAATAAAIAAILISTNWLRQLPSRAPVTRIVSRALLGGAAIAAVIAAVNPIWEGPATIAATVLTTSAVLIPTELERAVELLAGIACIGVGVALIGYGVVILDRTGIAAHALTWLASLTRDPSSEALHNDDPHVSGPDAPPGIRAPTSKPPQVK